MWVRGADPGFRRRAMGSSRLRTWPVVPLPCASSIWGRALNPVSFFACMSTDARIFSSNGGVFGSLYGTPIINLPQSAVLGEFGV